MAFGITQDIVCSALYIVALHCLTRDSVAISSPLGRCAPQIQDPTMTVDGEEGPELEEPTAHTHDQAPRAQWTDQPHACRESERATDADYQKPRAAAVDVGYIPPLSHAWYQNIVHKMNIIEQDRAVGLSRQVDLVLPRIPLGPAPAMPHPMTPLPFVARPEDVKEEQMQAQIDRDVRGEYPEWDQLDMLRAKARTLEGSRAFAARIAKQPLPEEFPFVATQASRKRHREEAGLDDDVVVNPRGILKRRIVQFQLDASYNSPQTRNVAANAGHARNRPPPHQPPRSKYYVKGINPLSLSTEELCLYHNDRNACRFMYLRRRAVEATQEYAQMPNALADLEPASLHRTLDATPRSLLPPSHARELPKKSCLKKPRAGRTVQ